VIPNLAAVPMGLPEPESDPEPEPEPEPDPEPELDAVPPHAVNTVSPLDELTPYVFE